MRVGFNLVGEEGRHRAVDVETDDPQVAFDAVKEHYSGRGIVRMLALIEGGKNVQESK